MDIEPTLTKKQQYILSRIQERVAPYSPELRNTITVSTTFVWINLSLLLTLSLMYLNTTTTSSTLTSADTTTSPAPTAAVPDHLRFKNVIWHKKTEDTPKFIETQT